MKSGSGGMNLRPYHPIYRCLLAEDIDKRHARRAVEKLAEGEWLPDQQETLDAAITFAKSLQRMEEAGVAS